MPIPEKPVDDDLRLEALRRYGGIGPAERPMLDDLADLARVLSGARHAEVNLIEADVQRTIAVSGGEVGVMPRAASLCTHVVSSKASIYTVDASLDDRLSDNPHVTGELATIRLYAGVPLIDPEGFVLGSLCVWDPAPLELRPDILRSLEKLAGQVVALLELHRRTQLLTAALGEVDRLARTDALTLLPNRRALQSRLSEQQESLAVLFADLDGFKSVNDRLGHEAGDQVLLAVAGRLTTGVREGDLVTRYGGDEFVVICEALDAESAQALPPAWRSRCRRRTTRTRARPPSGSASGRRCRAPTSRRWN
ncbi:MAG: sensor domain-containing diguanylate cyclase [Nakamurella sp.]